MKLPISKNIVLIFLLAAAVIGFVVFLTPQSSIAPGSTTSNSTNKDDNLNSYRSKGLKISFEYPNEWFVSEKDFDIMITSYMTKIGENKPPRPNEIKIFIDNYSGCFPTLEQDLIEPACGQGKVKNKIISKDVKQAPGGEFLKYTLDSYDENQRAQYFFQKGDKILQISKTPDPSQFEKEFEEIINSIKFID